MFRCCSTSWLRRGERSELILDDGWNDFDGNYEVLKFVGKHQEKFFAQNTLTEFNKLRNIFVSKFQELELKFFYVETSELFKGTTNNE